MYIKTPSQVLWHVNLGSLSLISPPYICTEVNSWSSKGHRGAHIPSWNPCRWKALEILWLHVHVKKRCFPVTKTGEWPRKDCRPALLISGPVFSFLTRRSEIFVFCLSFLNSLLRTCKLYAGSNKSFRKESFPHRTEVNRIEWIFIAAFPSPLAVSALPRRTDSGAWLRHLYLVPLGAAL